MQLYLLGVELAASLHADLALLEACLRNSMDRELAMSYGQFWFIPPVRPTGQDARTLADGLLGALA